MPSFTKEQLEAINKEGTNIIVSAGAGSGKTAVLTARVIRKLKSGVNINQLLILTFTNAAAKEMKQRIKREIKKDESLKEQLELVDSAFITTFDSYAYNIVKKYHYLLNVSPNLKIADYSIIHLEKVKIINRIFDEMYISKNPLFEKFINDFCEKDDTDLKNYILNIDNKLNMKIDKEKYINTYFENYLSDKKISEYIFEYEKLIKDKLVQIKDALEDISFICDGKYYEKLFDSLRSLIEQNNYVDIKDNLDVKLPQLPKNSEENLKEKKNYLTNLIKNLKDLCIYDNYLQIRDSFGMTFDYVTIILDIIKKLDFEINQFKYSNDLFEFSDIAKMSIDVIKNNKNVKEELRNKFNEIMVDEYQDTSDLQEYFINLIGNNNIYMVGDIKQSIYRFRNANPDIFKNKYEHYKNNDGGIKIDLTKNFRSRKEVLEDINLFFDELMDIDVGGADYKNGHQMVFGNMLYENLKPNQNYKSRILYYDESQTPKYTKEEIEYFSIIKDIKDKINNNYQVFDKDENKYRTIRYDDFSILVDRVATFTLAKKIFEYNQIPLAVYRDENITDSHDLIIIKNIIMLCLKEKNKEYDSEYKHLFMSLARSFLFEYSDEKIFTIMSKNILYADPIICQIKDISKNLDEISISQLLDKIIFSFKFYEKLVRVGNIDDSLIRLEYLYNTTLQLEEVGYTINDFAIYLGDVIDNSCELKVSSKESGANAVKIMTIHKSKGLEFPICYYPLLYKTFNLRDLTEKITYSNEYGIITPYYKYGMKKTILISLLKEKYIREEISERLRLFYVSLTRAKEQMILICPKDNAIVSSKIMFRSFSDYIFYENEKLEKFSENIDTSILGLTKAYNFIKKENYEKFIGKDLGKMTFRESNINYEILESVRYSKNINKLITKNELEKMKYGTMFHEVLEYIDIKNPNLDSIKDDFMRKKVRSFLNLDLFKNSSRVLKEVEFIFTKDNKEYHGIIDLLMESDYSIEIIDYKLKNIDDEHYVKQLMGYKEYIKTISNKPVNVYLYSIIDEELLKIEI